MRPALALVLLLPALCPADDAETRGIHSSRPDARLLPLPKEEGVFHFVIFGDRTGGPAEGVKVLAQAVRDTNLLGPDLVMTVGDLVEGYNRTPEWLAQMEEYRGIMDGLDVPWFPVAGNHDVYWGGSEPPPGQHEGNYEKHFGPLWYWFAHKNAAFVVLYSDEGDRATNRKGWGPGLNDMSPEQLEWLRKTVAETKGFDHVFVFLHHPRWIQPSYPGSNWDAVHAVLKEAGNVTAVFAGHIHRQRYDGVRDGIEYFTLAAVGASMPFDAPGTGHLHHVNLVTVRKDRITVATIPVGTVIDPREMTPEHLAEVDKVRGIAPLGVPVLSVAETGECTGELRVRLTNPAARAVEATVSLSSADEGWWLRPGHVHARIEPGATREIAFRCDRRGDLASLDAPELTLQLDYLGASMRVSLPETPVPVALRLVDPSPELFRPADASAALDGRSGRIEAALDLPQGPFTLEGWLCADAVEGLRAFAAKTEQSEYGIFVENGKPVFLVWLGGQWVMAGTEEAAIEAGRWQHLAGVFDGKELRLYVDGRLVARAAGAGERRRNGLPLCVGADPTATGAPVRYFGGRIDEVRVSTVARYEGESFEPARRVEPDEKTALLLHLDRLAGPFALDHSAAGAHALRRGGAEVR